MVEVQDREIIPPRWENRPTILVCRSFTSDRNLFWRTDGTAPKLRVNGAVSVLSTAKLTLKTDSSSLVANL